MSMKFKLVTCTVCAKEFTKHSNGVRKNNYCSTQCKLKGRDRRKRPPKIMVDVQCMHCEGIIQKPANRVGVLVFCGRYCQDQYHYAKELERDGRERLFWHRDAIKKGDNKGKRLVTAVVEEAKQAEPSNVPDLLRVKW